MNKIQRTQKEYDFDEVLETYKPDNEDIMNKEDETIHKIKNIIYSKLSPSDRNIILLYTELGTVRKVAKELHVAPSTAWIEINRIQTIIKDLC